MTSHMYVRTRMKSARVYRRADVGQRLTLLTIDLPRLVTPIIPSLFAGRSQLGGIFEDLGSSRSSRSKPFTHTSAWIMERLPRPVK